MLDASFWHSGWIDPVRNLIWLKNLLVCLRLCLNLCLRLRACLCLCLGLWSRWLLWILSIKLFSCLPCSCSTQLLAFVLIFILGEFLLEGVVPGIRICSSPQKSTVCWLARVQLVGRWAHLLFAFLLAIVFFPASSWKQPASSHSEVGIHPPCPHPGCGQGSSASCTSSPPFLAWMLLAFSSFLLNLASAAETFHPGQEVAPLLPFSKDHHLQVISPSCRQRGLQDWAFSLSSPGSTSSLELLGHSASCSRSCQKHFQASLQRFSNSHPLRSPPHCSYLALTPKHCHLRRPNHPLSSLPSTNSVYLALGHLHGHRHRRGPCRYRILAGQSRFSPAAFPTPLASQDCIFGKPNPFSEALGTSGANGLKPCGWCRPRSPRHLEWTCDLQVCHTDDEASQGLTCAFCHWWWCSLRCWCSPWRAPGVCRATQREQHFSKKHQTAAGCTLRGWSLSLVAANFLVAASGLLPPPRDLRLNVSKSATASCLYTIAWTKGLWKRGISFKCRSANSSVISQQCIYRYLITPIYKMIPHQKLVSKRLSKCKSKLTLTVQTLRVRKQLTQVSFSKNTVGGIPFRRTLFQKYM